MAGVEIIKVKEQDDGMRLNRWFLKYYPGLSLGRLQKLLRTKQIRVDAQKAEASLRLAAGQEIRVPPLEKEAEKPAEVGLSSRDCDFMRQLVIYKDDNVIVLNKPSGLAVQGGSKTTRHIDGMLAALQFDKPEKPRLVHRIDKDTSGLLVLARDRKNADLLTKAFREHLLEKEYLALVSGCPAAEEGEIKAPLAKIGENAVVRPDGKPATTIYRVLDNSGDKFALLAVAPLTGRTHQIRAHLQHIGCPIVGDDRYFGQTRQKYAEISDKLHLHAYKINLSAIYNKKLLLKAALPSYFKQSLETLGIRFKE